MPSVRALLASGHAICFGLGDGNGHLTINKAIGETNRVRDDGVNYLQDMLVVPPDKLEEVMKAMHMMNPENSPWRAEAEPEGTESSPRQGP